MLAYTCYIISTMIKTQQYTIDIKQENKPWKHHWVVACVTGARVSYQAHVDAAYVVYVPMGSLDSWNLALRQCVAVMMHGLPMTLCEPRSHSAAWPLQPWILI